MSIIKDQQLQILLNQFGLISKITLLQLAILKNVLEDPTSEELYEEALTNETLIDRLEVKIREEVAFTVFKFSPMAEDLRRIVSYQDLTTNLERIGDMVLNCIRTVRESDLNRPEHYSLRALISEMLDLVTQMIRNAILSFSNMELNTAEVVIESDDVVDDKYKEIRRYLAESGAFRELSVEQVQEILQLDNLAHNLERCGDSATNIAEATIYLIRGRDIRHTHDEITDSMTAAEERIISKSVSSESPRIE